MRRTKATLIYRRTKHLRAVQLLLGHTKLESSVRYLGIEVNDALEMAKQTEVQPKYRGRSASLALTRARLRHSKSRDFHLEAAARGYLVGEWYARSKADRIEARQTVAIWRVFAGFSVIYE
jgi:hypothetical protein